MSSMNTLSARSRCASPRSTCSHSSPGMRRGDDIEGPCPVDVLALRVDRERDPLDREGRGRTSAGALATRRRRAGRAAASDLAVELGDVGCPHHPAVRPRAPTVPSSSTKKKTCACCRDVKSPGQSHLVNRHSWTADDRSGGQSVAGRGSLGRPRTRSPTMLRWIWLVPPQIVSDREKKNADIIGLTG